MAAWWQGVVDDFSDLPDPGHWLRVAVRLLIAAGLGGALGWERWRSGKEAGLRTHMLVAVGAALFVLAPQQAGLELEGVSRVIQGLVAGIGFLGAGTIVKLTEEHRVRGLTTAAGIWLTAALGVAAGMGREATAVLGAVLALVILAALGRVERRLNGAGCGPDPDDRPAA